MKNRSNTLKSALAISLFALAFAGCTRSSGQGNGGFSNIQPEIEVESFFEAESNDLAEIANDFGILIPGDYFLIEGSISDNGSDPFDGFLFTSGQPIHVDFRLFIDDVRTDFDVCLYDPEFDEILACYETSDNPELGGVDLLDGFVDFHLVVSSFVGSGTYALEIDVQPLFLREGTPESGSMIAPRFINAVDQAESDLGMRSSEGMQSFSAYRKAAAIEEDTKLGSKISAE